MLLQYPNTDGQINDYSQVIEKAHGQEKKVSIACIRSVFLLLAYMYVDTVVNR